MTDDVDDELLAEPPNFSRLEFLWNTDLYAIHRDDASAKQAGYPVAPYGGDGGTVWCAFPESAPCTWAEMIDRFGWEALSGAKTWVLAEHCGEVAAILGGQIKAYRADHRTTIDELLATRAERDEARETKDMHKERYVLADREAAACRLVVDAARTLVAHTAAPTTDYFGDPGGEIHPWEAERDRLVGLIASALATLDRAAQATA